MKILKKPDLILCFLLMIAAEAFFKLALNIEIKLYASFLSIIVFALFISFANLFDKKVRIILESIYVCIWNIYLFSQHYYYMFFKSFWSVFNLTQINELVGVSGEILMKFDIVLLVYTLFILIWFVIIAFFSPEEKDKTSKSLLFPVIFGVLSVFMSSFTVSAYDSFAGYIVKQSERDYLYQTMLDKTAFVEEFGLTEYIKRDVQKALNTGTKTLTTEEKMLVEEWTKKPIKNEWTGLFKGKDLIFVQAESLANEAIDPVLTPTLYKLMQEGIYFENFYAPLYPANTNDSEYIFQTGLMPSIEGSTTSYKCENNYFPYSLANAFKKEGYNVNSYHSFFGEFYNRIKMHETLGFDNFYSVKDILSEYEDKVNGVFWVDDLELAKAYQENSFDSPYYSFIITTSGHAPYYDERSELEEEFIEVKKYWGNKYNDELAYYQASQMKLDKALEYLLENNPDAVIVVVGDHFPYSLSDESLDMFLKPDYKRLNVPFIIYSSEVEHQVVSSLRSSFDVYPTLINLFGLEGEYFFGVDALSEEQSTLYLVTGIEITEDEIIKNSSSQAWNVGQIILSTDYYKNKNS